MWILLDVGTNEIVLQHVGLPIQPDLEAFYADRCADVIDYALDLLKKGM